MSTALITSAARGSALSFIRSLGRRGWRIAAASDQRVVPGFVSRYTDERIRHPGLLDDHRAGAECLVEAARRLVPDLVVPITDLDIHALRHRRSRLPASTVVAVADDAALDATLDKLATIELARSCGVPIPPTVAAEGPAETPDVVAELAGPYVVKPRRSVRIVGDRAVASRVALAADARGLAAALRDRGPSLVQPWVPGVGVGVELLMHEGRALAALQHRRLRETPWTGGASSARVTEALDDGLLTHATSMLGALGWTGLAMVEFRVGPDGPMLMEINGRVWGSLPLAVRAGMDFPARLADLLMGGPPADGRLASDYRVGVCSRDLKLEWQWVAGAWNAAAPFPGPVPPRRAEAVRVGLRLLDPRGHDAADWRDPAPAVLTMMKAAAVIVRRAAGG